jgi:hypothetical protein
MARALLALTFALALLTGCGGGDDKGGGGGGGGKELSQEQFIADANKICREGAEKIQTKTGEIQQKMQEAGNDAQAQEKVIADVLEETAKDYQPYLDRLHDLNPPSDIDAEWDKFLGGIDEAFDKIPEVADATRDRDRDKLQDLTADFERIGNETRPFASKYKLDDCQPDQTAPTS